MGKKGILNLGYNLLFKNHPRLSRTPVISSSYSNKDKDNALSTSIQDLLSKQAIEKAKKKTAWDATATSSWFQNRKTSSYRPKLPKLFPPCHKIQNGNPRINKVITQERGVGHLNIPDGQHTFTYQSIHSPESSSGSTTEV